jgi:hypothetical protein
VRPPVSGPDGAPLPATDEPAKPETVTVAGAPGRKASPEASLRACPETDTAVFVSHGMGQQVPFETLQLVIKAMQDNAGLGKVDVVVDLIPEDPALPKGPTLPVAMASWLDPDAGPGSAHFFECYWAPLIEGKVGVWDVFSFLCKAGARGVRFAWKGAFTRRIFNRDRVYGLGGTGTKLRLALALLLVLSLGCLAPTFLVTTLARALFNFGFAVPRGDGLFRLLEADLLLLSRLLLAGAFPFLVKAGWEVLLPRSGKRSLAGSSFLAAFASLYFFLVLYELPWQAVAGSGAYFYATLLAYSACRDSRQGKGSIGPVAGLLWMYLLAIAITLIGMGAFCFWSWTHFWNLHEVPKAVPWLSGRMWVPESIRAGLVWVSGLLDRAALSIPRVFARDQGLFHKPFLILHAAAGAGLFAGARFFLIEYAGDVAAYVSSHTVDRFYDVREKIQEACLRVAAHVYEAKAADLPRYKRVIVVGHSLGSVLAYDTLNRMVLRDRLSGGTLRVADRTPLLLTFGSPLDKTAFLFRTQLPAADVREGLAEARQPLIHDYAYRPRRWINIWSPNDIVCGPLEFYDLPTAKKDPAVEPKGRRIRNLKDPEASMPLAAHTQYWTNPLLAKILARGLKGTL